MSTNKRPNFLIIVADGMYIPYLGYSDIGCYGSEIRTPNLDQLAEDGAKFSNYYTSAACSPTRAMLLSGTDNHIAGLGVMSEQKGLDPERWDVPGHEGYLNYDVAALSELLQDGGYSTLMSGKWHLGLKPENNPHKRGFDRSFALLPGGSNHYGWEPQLGADGWKFFGGAKSLLYTVDGEDYTVPPNTTADPKGFYSSDYYTDNLISYLSDRSAEDKQKKPFFAFLPFSAPHWPLQCPKQYRDRYKGMYDDGPDALRLRRLAALQKLGIYKDDIVPHPTVAPAAIPEWQDMTPYQRQQSARAMETFAGMVDNMDANIGRLLAHLKRTGEYDNTFICFMSDNGAEGAAYEAIPVMGPNLMDAIATYYDNSVENIGNYDSFVWYGPRWASASTAPSRMYKMWSTEGGIKVPMIVRHPGFCGGKQGGALVRAFGTVMDVAATVLELAGVEHPAKGGGKGVFRGREVAPLRGVSWVPFMNSQEADADELGAIHDGTRTMGWELFGRAAIRRGQYKLVHVEPFGGGRADGKWQLYDLEKDPGETEDLSEAMPEKYAEMLGKWEEYQRETGAVWGPPIKMGFGGPGKDGEGREEGEEVREGVIGKDDKEVEQGDKDFDVVEQTQDWMKVRKDENASGLEES